LTTAPLTVVEPADAGEPPPLPPPQAVSAKSAPAHMIKIRRLDRYPFSKGINTPKVFNKETRVASWRGAIVGTIQLEDFQPSD
jgi:hypothetical protein